MSTLLELVVSIYMGRNFPRLPAGHRIRVQSTIVSQVRESLPSDLPGKSGKIGNVLWKDGGTLAWSFTKEDLAQIKGKNPVVKLYLYSSGAATAGAVANTNALGYVTVDLRSPTLYMSRGDIKPRWHKVSGGVSFGGELQLSAKISAKARERSGGEVNPLESMVVSADASYIQIGNGENNRLYNLEVTLIASKGLGLLPIAHEEDVSDPFWLTYCMFGVVTETDKFERPDKPAFHPIVDSFQVRSDQTSFADFLEYEARPLDVYLRTTDSNVAVAKIDLSKLASVMRGKSFHGAEIEGSYVFHPLFETTRGRKRKGVGKPLLAAKVAIRPVDDDDVQPSGPPAEGRVSMGSGNNSAAATGQELESPDLENADTPVCADAKEEECLPQPDVGEVIAEGEERDDNYSDEEFEEEREENKRGTEPQYSAPEQNELSRATVRSGDESGSSQTKPTVDALDQPHRFRVSIDLRSIKEVAERGTYCLLYSYPVVGCVSPIRTRPPIRVDRNSEVLLPHGYTMFEFVMSPSKLQDELQGTPLLVELHIKDKYQKDGKVGVATIPFEPLLNSKEYYRDPKTRKTFPSLSFLRNHQRMSSSGRAAQSRDSEGAGSKYVVVKAHDQYFQVISDIGTAGRSSSDLHAQRLGKTASIRVVIFFEDLGPVAPDDRMTTEDAGALTESALIPPNQSRADNISALMGDSPSLNLSKVLKAPQDTTGFSSELHEHASMTARKNHQNMDAAELIAGDTITQTAMQNWFAQEYMEWEEKMKRKEASRMKKLDAEWAGREAERHKAVIEAQERYGTLEEKLRKRLSLVEQRERQLANKESELERLAMVQLEEGKILQRRLEEELHHKLNIERQKSNELEKRLKESEKEKIVAKKRVASIEHDFHKFKEDQRRTPESKLRERINQLTSEKAEAEAKLIQEQSNNKLKESALEKSRLELASVIQELEAERREKREAAEKGIEQLRLQYLAREERYVLDGDREELRRIKDELETIRRANMFGMKISNSAPTPSRIPKPSVNYSATAEPNVDRLKKERDILMDTGAYADQHPIIVEIDRQIEMETAAMNKASE